MDRSCEALSIPVGATRTRTLPCASSSKSVAELKPLTTSPELQKVIATIRSVVPSLEEDRYMANDLKAATDLVASGALAASVSADILPVLEA